MESNGVKKTKNSLKRAQSDSGDKKSPKKPKRTRYVKEKFDIVCEAESYNFKARDKLLQEYKISSKTLSRWTKQKKNMEHTVTIDAYAKKIIKRPVNESTEEVEAEVTVNQSTEEVEVQATVNQVAEEVERFPGYRMSISMDLPDVMKILEGIGDLII